MDSEQDLGQTSTPTPLNTPMNQSGSSIAWGSAFKSPEFISGLQNAMSQVLRQFQAPVERVAELERMGNPTAGVTTSSARPEGQVGDEPRSHFQNPGMFTAPSFVASTSYAEDAQAIPVMRGAASLLHQNLEPTTLLTSGTLLNSSPESAFILGPGRAPIPAKLVKRILSHEYIEMSELIPENLEDPPSEAMVLTLEGSTVVPKPNASKKGVIADILTWVECFNSYITVLTSACPSRSRDLLAYMALIIRTAKRFGGTAWQEYDRAYRREAAASNLRDWSEMRPDLFNYHTSFVNRTVPPRSESKQPIQRSFRNEPQGRPSAKQLCISWNAGFCSSAYQNCRFRHMCSYPGCNGYHRLLEHNSLSQRKRNRTPERPNNSRRARSK